MFENIKNSRIYKIGGVLVTIVLLFISFKLQRPDDIKLLKKTLTVSGVSKVLDPDKLNDVREGKIESEDNMIIDSSEDVFFSK